MEYYAERPVFMSLKDHKENFKNNKMSTPLEDEMHIVSETFLEEINKTLRNHLWQGTSMVMEWFRAIENKKTPVNSISFT